MGKIHRVLGVAVLLQALATVPALAQELHGQKGVFEGFAADRMGVRTTHEEASWIVDQYTRFANGRPSPGDWVHVEVDPYGRAVEVLVEEHPARVSATVDHIEGRMVVARTNYGVEMWNEVPTTWHIGIAPGGLLPGDSIDVGVFRNRNLAFLRLDSRPNVPPPPPPEMAPEAPPPLSDAGVIPDGGDALQAQVAPPPLPVYDPPPCPEPDYIWTPGYWRWGPVGYYWVPGVWVAPPAPGLLWTPGYWGFLGGVYIFHAGYWGAHVGFYGGVVYGAGYYGQGFVGARWEGGHVVYNTAAVPVNTTLIHNTYVNNTVVINNQTTTINNITNNINKTNNVSFNGGAGGTAATPTAAERQWGNEPHAQPTAMQLQHIQAARVNPQLQHSFNQGRPPVLSAVKPMAPPPRAATGGLNRLGQPTQPQGKLQPQGGATPPPEARSQVQPKPTPEPRPQTQPHPPAQPRPQAPPAHKEEKRDEGREHDERR